MTRLSDARRPAVRGADRYWSGQRRMVGANCGGRRARCCVSRDRGGPVRGADCYRSAQKRMVVAWRARNMARSPSLTSQPRAALTAGPPGS